MAELERAAVLGQLVDVLAEAVEGPKESWSYFTDSGPEAGLLGSVAKLGAAAASKPSGRAGTTVAGHVHHVAFALRASAGWIRGERVEQDWSRSWSVKAVDEAEWKRLLEETRAAYQELAGAIREHGLDGAEALGGAVGAVAHAAYHLGAIRQKLAG